MAMFPQRDIQEELQALLEFEEKQSLAKQAGLKELEALMLPFPGRRADVLSASLPDIPEPRPEPTQEDLAERAEFTSLLTPEDTYIPPVTRETRPADPTPRPEPAPEPSILDAPLPQEVSSEYPGLGQLHEPEKERRYIPPVPVQNAELQALLTPEDIVTQEAMTPREPSEPWTLERATRPIRFGVANVAMLPGMGVYAIPAMLTSLLADIEEATPTDDVPRSARRGPEGTFQAEPSGIMRAVSDYLKTAAEGSRKGIEYLTSTEGIKPETPLEHAGSWIGEYLFPYARGARAIPAFTKSLSEFTGPKIITEAAKSYTVPLTTSAVAARAGLTAFGPDDVPSLVGTAQAAETFDPSKTLGPKTTGGWGPVAPVPGAPSGPTPVAPGATVARTPVEKLPGETDRQARDRIAAQKAVAPAGMIIPAPDDRHTTPPNVKRREGRLDKKTGLRVGGETDEQYAIRRENAWRAKEIAARTYTDTANRIFMTAGGKQKVYETEYAVMGIAAGAVGLAFAPKIYSKLLRGEVPGARAVAREVPEAAPGTLAISTVVDTLRIQDDVIAPLHANAVRAGMPVEAADKLLQEHRIITRNGGRQLADGGLETGRIETPSYTFRAPVPLNDIARKSTPQSDEYLRLRAQRDEMQAAATPAAKESIYASKGKKEVTEKDIARITDRQAINDIDKAIDDIEKANPGIAQVARGVQAHNTAKIKLAEQGEYGIYTKAEADTARMSHTNYLGEGKTIGSLSDDFKGVVKERLDNEAKGRYVDAVRELVPPSASLPEGGKNLFRKISKKEYDEGSDEFRRNTVTFKRRGEMEYYSTDPFIADVIRADHHMVTGIGSNILYGSKRLLETTTTGLLAPNFAVVSALRSYWIAKFTTDAGFRAPTILGSIMAIPQQLVPQIAKSFSRGLETGSQGRLGELFGQEWMETWSKRLAIHADESVYMQLKSAGSHRGSVIEQQQRARGFEIATKRFDDLIGATGGAASPFRGAQHFWNVWKASLESVHNAVGFNFVKRNMGREGMPELALRARRLTGDPRTGGTLFVREGIGQRPIRYQGDDAINQAVADTLRLGYGYTMEGARQAIPWWNATLQGAKRIGEAWVTNPTRFARSTALYAMAPAAGMFYYAKMLDMDDPVTGKKGGDPFGRSYLDYLLNGRSAYNRQMNFYIPIPGQPAEDGVEITFFHELNPFKRLMEISLHHMLGSDKPDESLRSLWTTGNTNGRRSLREDLWIAAHMFLDTAVIPPMPPAAGAVAGAFGVRLPQGIFGGEAYPIKGDPYNQNGGMPNSLEASTRAIMGGVSEAIGGFYAAFANADPGEGLSSGGRQVIDIFTKKTPILRDWTRVLPDISNNTDIAKEAFEHQREYNDLARFFKKWTVNQGAINVKPPSIGGGAAVPEQYGLSWLNAGNPGLGQDQPTNPLYIQFMQDFYNRFSKESPNFVKGKDEGGIAFKSLWANYGDATQKINRLKDVNHGSYAQWQRNLNMTQEQQDAETDPYKQNEIYLFRLAKYELDKEGVDTTDRRQVVNFYRKKQFEALRVINYVRRAVEEDFTNSEWNKLNNGGRPVNFKSIKPFLEPEMQEPWFSALPGKWTAPDIRIPAFGGE